MGEHFHEQSLHKGTQSEPWGNSCRWRSCRWAGPRGACTPFILRPTQPYHPQFTDKEPGLRDPLASGRCFSTSQRSSPFLSPGDLPPRPSAHPEPYRPHAGEAGQSQLRLLLSQHPQAQEALPGSATPTLTPCQVGGGSVPSSVSRGY